MRELTVHVEGRGYRGSWDTWSDTHYGRMVQAAYKGWTAEGPAHEEDPERMAEHLLSWCVERSIHGSHPGRGR